MAWTMEVMAGPVRWGRGDTTGDPRDLLLRSEDHRPSPVKAKVQVVFRVGLTTMLARTVLLRNGDPDGGYSPTPSASTRVAEGDNLPGT